MNQRMSKMAARQECNQVAAVVVTYNRIDMLKQCLTHLRQQTYPCDVLVVNNASTDGTETFLEKYAAEHINIHVHNQATNTGGAGGFNHGMRWAVEAGYDYVWVMDDDCLPNPDALEKLMEADEILNGEYGWLSSKCLWTDGSICPMNVQRKTPYREIKLEEKNNGLIPAQIASFVSLLVRRETVLQYGLPIKEFFIWSDDWEYTRRISRNEVGYVVSSSVVMHAMKSNIESSIALDSEDRLDRYNYAFRNENYLYRREGIKGFVFYTAKCMLNLFRIIKSAKCNKPERCKIIIKQFFEGLFFNPSVESTGK